VFSPAPAAAVAVPAAGKFNVLLTMAVPFTSSVGAGVLVLIPILVALPVPVWYTTGSSIVEAPVR